MIDPKKLSRRNLIQYSSLAAAVSLVRPTSAEPWTRPERFTIHFDSPEELASYTRLSALQQTQPLLMAHRAGFSPQGRWPENALESARRVLRKGPAMIEIDLRTTADGEIVCVHDGTLDRETTGWGPVSEVTYGEIKKLRLVDFVGRPTRFKVRTFDEFLEFGSVGAFLWLDIKDADPEVVIAKIREHHAEARVVVSAYGLEKVLHYRSLAPELVYFIPVIPGLDLPTVQAILDNVADPGRVIGFAGFDVPNLERSLQMRDHDIPALLDLASIDQRMDPQNLSPGLYSNAIAEGFPMFNTEQYVDVLKLLGITAWA